MIILSMDIRVKFLRNDKGRTSQGSFIDPEFVLHIVFSGRLTFQIQERIYTIEQGDMILIPPNKLHAVINPVEVYMQVIHFYDHTNLLDGLNLDPVLSPDAYQFFIIRGLSEQLGLIWDKGRKEDSLIADGLLHTLIGYFISLNPAYSKRGAPGQHKNWKSIHRGVVYIQKHFQNKDLTIGHVSSQCGLSYHYFSTLFKEYTNESPHHYLIRTRLEFAKEVMFNGKCNISQAAEAAGFRSLSNFSKVFKQYEVVSPRDWLDSR
jgi:AraC-like DNA-binding protein